MTASHGCLLICSAGMLKVDGLLPRRCRMFDTPGVPHPFQLHARLNPEEVLQTHPQMSASVLSMS